MATSGEQLSQADVLDMPWDELLERLADLAAAGDKGARFELGLLLAEGEEAAGAIGRLSASAVLRRPQPRGREETDV